MQRIKLLMAISPLFISLIRGGTPDTTSQNMQHPPRGLQFSINQLSLGSFQGATLSYVRMIQTNQFSRWGVSFSTNSQLASDDISTLYYNANDSSTTTGNPDDDNELNVAMNLTVKHQTLKQRPAFNDMSLFWGWGPLAGLTWQSSRTESETRLSTSKRPTVSAGVTGTVGTEWFLRSNLSLHAEYQSSLIFTYQHRRNFSKLLSPDGSYTEYRSTRDTYQFSGSSKALMGITLWFM